MTDRGSEIIRLEDAGRSYADGGLRIPALRGASLSVRSGDFIGVSGPSGSGKTTLLSILGCLVMPDAGEMFYRGNPVSKMREDERAAVRSRGIGFVFQEVVLLEGLKVWENVVIPLLMGGKTKAERGVAIELLERVGLAVRADSATRGLSFGERKRVALARALANGPEIILADEPTGGLDTETADSVFAILEKANSDVGKTVVFVTHDERYAARAGRRIEIRDGMLLE